MIEVKVVADSINARGNRITSMECTYFRFIHSEVMTHRAFARNAASSRAIPVETMLKRIKEEPAMPYSWGKNQKGMQAEQELSEQEQKQAQWFWLKARDEAMFCAQRMVELGVHKQIANRLLEPFAHITTLITATEWGNFFNLRCHKDAMPEFQRLAWLMLKRYTESTPALKQYGEWHLPYADKYIEEGLSIEQLLKISTARAARTSYLTMNKEISHPKDYELHDGLLINGHMSPLEHPAVACDTGINNSGPFKGWMQYRKQCVNENRRQYDVEKLLQACPFQDWLEQQ